MTNVVLLGGNGYIGRNVTEKWIKKDSSAVFYVISRSGKNQLVNSRIYNLAADVSDYKAVAAVLPDQVDYIVDFVGRPESDPAAFEEVNDKPAQVMLQ
ncbi:NAD-dependent epimerase/dehydratase family protein, partial [Streptococcus suis]|uniref:NAD-dependent epimerase/dehydratase family protein n=1 Tax=Streptococcus suis TaxID=1307 RepID=UPI00129066D9